MKAKKGSGRKEGRGHNGKPVLQQGANNWNVAFVIIRAFPGMQCSILCQFYQAVIMPLMGKGLTPQPPPLFPCLLPAVDKVPFACATACRAR